MKVIFHLDLDSYFVSAERTINPSLMGKAVVISSGGRRSIITASSYEAKAKGIHIPMPLYRAINIDPDLIIIKPNFPFYVNLSNKVFNKIKTYSSLIEIGSIDECYIDVTDKWKKFGSIKNMAKEIQKTIKKEFQLDVSIGISSTKFVAKMSTSINKPFGITITPPEKFLDVFGNWPVNKTYGIGNPTADVLKKHNILFIKDIINTELFSLETILGKRAIELKKNVMCKGSDFISEKTPEFKNISNSITFQDKDRSNIRELLEILQLLSWKVSSRAQSRNLVAKVISVGMKITGGKEIKPTSKQKTLVNFISNYEDIFAESKKLFDELWKGENLKFLSITIAKLQTSVDASEQMNIFNTKKYNKIEKIINGVNQNFNKNVLSTADQNEKELTKKSQTRLSNLIDY